ncbi:hypothetical protein FS749_000618 [Ceratobasidium sp. UAMH 11750]|nr:hypothetical protein FS749_000618 [Ceratobasidium sp. UAMH 11750]
MDADDRSRSGMRRGILSAADHDCPTMSTGIATEFEQRDERTGLLGSVSQLSLATTSKPQLRMFALDNSLSQSARFSPFGDRSDWFVLRNHAAGIDKPSRERYRVSIPSLTEHRVLQSHSDNAGPDCQSSPPCHSQFETQAKSIQLASNLDLDRCGQHDLDWMVIAPRQGSVFRIQRFACFENLTEARSWPKMRRRWPKMIMPRNQTVNPPTLGMADGDDRGDTHFHPLLRIVT